jgi:hypothetical protein
MNTEMKRVFYLLFFVILVALPVCAQDDGNPANWCRNGPFTSYQNLRPARVTGGPKTRVNFFGDEGNCPTEGNCQLKSYLLAGDQLIAAKSYDKFTCVWYQAPKGRATVGWIPTEKLTFSAANENPPLKSWLGAWKFYDNSINIALPKGKPGSLYVTGQAYWRGLGDNIHTGEIDATGQPAGNLFESAAKEEYDCGFTLRLIGKYLIVKDNLQCGGANVTFSGVYVK